MFDDDGDVIDDAFELVQVRSFRHDTDEGFCPGRTDEDAAFIAELERRVVGIEPGLTLLLDLGVAHGRERTRGRELLGGTTPDRIERERDEFFERVRAGFLRRAAEHPQRIRVLDASPSAEQVASAALQALAAYRKDLA